MAASRILGLAVGGYQTLRFIGTDCSNKNSTDLSRSLGGRIKKMPAIGQECRTTVTALSCRQFGYGDRLTALRLYSKQSGIARRCEDNDIVAIPCPASTVGSIRERLRRSTIDIDPFKPSLSEEAD